MSYSPAGARWTLASLDWEGNHVAHWTMTPSHLTDPVHVIADEPRDCIPLYPLRYGLTEESCRIDGLDGVTVADYPDEDLWPAPAETTQPRLPALSARR